MTNRTLIYNNEKSSSSLNVRYHKIGTPRVGLRGDLIYIKDLFEKLSTKEAISYLKYNILCSATPKAKIVISMEDLGHLIHELENKE